MKVMDTHARSIAKAISWRILATIITATVVWKISGKSELGVSVGIIDSLFKLVLYYGHERFWNLVPVGLSKRSGRQALQAQQVPATIGVAEHDPLWPVFE